MAFIAVLMVLATPFIEIALFIKVGQWIGVLPTIALTILSTVVGLAIVRRQGLTNLLHMQRALAQRQIPLAGMTHAILLALAGLCLAIPGFFTDFIGLLLLIPPVRTMIGLVVISRFKITVQGHQENPSDVVDAEFWEEADTSHGRDTPRLPPRAND